VGYSWNRKGTKGLQTKEGKKDQGNSADARDNRVLKNSFDGATLLTTLTECSQIQNVHLTRTRTRTRTHTHTHTHMHMHMHTHMHTQTRTDTHARTSMRTCFYLPVLALDSQVLPQTTRAAAASHTQTAPIQSVEEQWKCRN
jgi:hypothetical protein